MKLVLLLVFISLMPLAVPAVVAQELGPAAFGSSEKTDGAMIGIFYDLKQTQKRENLPNDYLKTLGEFLDSGWDENVLSRFFRGTKPVYATEVLIPTMKAAAAPQAFHLENVVRPSSWFVIYKGQVSPPEDGTYRFVGVADDVLAVGVNGRTVLVSHFSGMTDHSHWVEPSPKERIPCWAGVMKRGDWFECKKDQIIDLDILVGEFPGNLFGAWLLIEKKGESYPVVKDSGGKPVLPLFQVKARPDNDKKKDVPFSINDKPWTCHR